MSQIRLGDLLIRAGVVSDAQLNTALAEQKQWGGRLGTILVRMGALSEDLLVKALSRQLGVPRAALGPTDPITVPDGVLARIDRATCERLLVVPVAYVKERRTVQMAIADPFNVVAIDDLSRRLGVRVETLLAGETQIMQAIGRVYSGAPQVSQQQTENIGFMDNSGRAIGHSPVVAPQPMQPLQWAPPPPPPPPTTQPQWAPAPPQPPQPAWTSPPAPAPTWRPAAAAAPPTFTASFAPPPNPGSAPASAAPAVADDLRALADQQLRAVRALVELLIDKGVVSRAELSAWLARGG